MANKKALVPLLNFAGTRAIHSCGTTRLGADAPTLCTPSCAGFVYGVPLRLPYWAFGRSVRPPEPIPSSFRYCASTIRSSLGPCPWMYSSRSSVCRISAAVGYLIFPLVKTQQAASLTAANYKPGAWFCQVEIFLEAGACVQYLMLTLECIFGFAQGKRPCGKNSGKCVKLLPGGGFMNIV